MDLKIVAGELQCRIYTLQRDVIYKAVEEIGGKFGLKDLSDEEKRAAARALYWTFGVEEESLWPLLGQSPLDVSDWLEWGQLQFRCTGCAKIVGVWFKMKDSRDESDIGSVMCKDCHRKAFERWDSWRRAQEAEEAERERLSRVAELRSMPYPDYLQTPEWKARRDRQVDDDGGACRLCGSRDHLNVHHRTYERLGEEQPLDLITLCYACHQSFHENRNLCNGPAPPGSTASGEPSTG